MATTDALANDFEQAWRSDAGRAVRVRGWRGACQRVSADDDAVARRAHIRALVLHGENSADLSERVQSEVRLTPGEVDGGGIRRWTNGRR